MQTPPANQTVSWVALVLSIVAIVVGSAALAVALLRPGFGPGMMGVGACPGMIGGGFGPGMMGVDACPRTMRGWFGPDGGLAAPAQPGDPGFAPGTEASPRVIRVAAGPGLVFSPSTIAVARGETVTFLVTTVGPIPHDFMVGPADAVAANQAGTPEIESIRMTETGALTLTFDTAGPYAFACHVAGHFEAGMRGTITVVE